MDEPMDPVAALVRLGGVATRRELLRLTRRRALDAAVAAGALVSQSRSVIGLPVLAEPQVARAAGGTLGGLSAALHWKWAVKKPPAQPVVIVPRNRGRQREGVTLVRWDLDPVEQIGDVLAPAPTVVHCARTLPFDEALCVADSALRSGRVQRPELVEAAHRLARPRCVLDVLDYADHRAANPFESVPRAIARDIPGLQLTPQVNADGIGHGDLVDEALRIVVECESWQFHSPPDAFRYDVRRYTRMTLADWVVVRVVWEDVMHQPDEVRRQLEQAVLLAGRRGRTRT